MIRAILILQLFFFTWGGMFTAHTMNEKRKLESTIERLLYLRIADLSMVEVVS